MKTINRIADPEAIGAELASLIAAVLGGDNEINITIRKASAPAAPKPVAVAGRMSPQQRRIVEALADQPPRKAIWISQKLHVVCGGGFRAVLSGMLKSGVLCKGTDGYGYQLPPTEKQK